MSKKSVDIFAAASVKKAVPVKAIKDEKVEIQMGGNINVLVALTNLGKLIEEQIKIRRPEVDDEVREIFVENGLSSGLKPDSFLGVSDNASVHAVLSKRSTASKITAEQKALLDDAGLTACYEEKVVVEPIDECFILNSKILGDRKKMGALSKALNDAGLTEIDGEPILMLQEGREAVTSNVVADKAIDLAFAKGKVKGWAPAKMSEIMEALTTLVLKDQKLKDGSMDGIFSILKDAGINFDD